MRRIAAALLTAALALTATGCVAEDAATQAYRDGTNQGYISSEFRWVEIPADKRGAPVVFAGVTEDGGKLSSTDLAGKVTVVNFWYASCGPCRAEAKDLQTVWQQFDGQGVRFVGVNTSDQASTARAFTKEFGITYPSFIDQGDGAVKLAFARATPITSTPTTLVLDKQGRVAARILGQLEGTSILATLVKDTLAEQS